MAEDRRHDHADHGSVVNETSLNAAVDELHKQHPHHQIAHSDDRGPYHGGDEHCRHIPVVGHSKRPYSK
jgi:hypothetical protein